MTSPERVRRDAKLASIHTPMRGLKEGQEFRHSRPQGGVRAPQYVQFRKNVTNHGEVEAELQALDYEYQWHRKGSTVWRDSRYVPAFGLDLAEEDWPAEEPSVGTRVCGGHHPRAANAGDFMEVT